MQSRVVFNDSLCRLLFFFLQFPDPKQMQLNLTGFLHGKNARLFMQELWDLLISAQQNTSGIPTVFLEKKKEELRQKKVCVCVCVCVQWRRSDVKFCRQRICRGFDLSFDLS